MFLYVHSDDFQIYFASDSWRQKFKGFVHRITEGFEETGFIADLDTDVGSTSIPVSIPKLTIVIQKLGKNRLYLSIILKLFYSLSTITMTVEKSWS